MKILLVVQSCFIVALLAISISLQHRNGVLYSVIKANTKAIKQNTSTMSSTMSATTMNSESISSLAKLVVRMH